MMKRYNNAWQWSLPPEIHGIIWLQFENLAVAFYGIWPCLTQDTDIKHMKMSIAMVSGRDVISRKSNPLLLLATNVVTTKMFATWTTFKRSLAQRQQIYLSPCLKSTYCMKTVTSLDGPRIGANRVSYSHTPVIPPTLIHPWTRHCGYICHV